MYPILQKTTIRKFQKIWKCARKNWTNGWFIVLTSFGSMLRPCLDCSCFFRILSTISISFIFLRLKTTMWHLVENWIKLVSSYSKLICCLTDGIFSTTTKKFDKIARWKTFETAVFVLDNFSPYTAVLVPTDTFVLLYPCPLSAVSSGDQ